MTEQLKALAEAAKGWKFDHIQQCDDEPIEVGQMSDGEFYQIATIDCEQYGESSRPLAEYLVQASPERILALIAENEAHSRKDAEPVAAFVLSKADNKTPFTWAQGSKAVAEYEAEGFAVTKLYTHPPEADKLLQQALDALNYHTEQTRPILQTDAARLAIRTYLEGKK